MAFKINFDENNLPVTPQFLLSKRSGDIIGLITNVSSVVIDVSIDIPTITFKVNKGDNGQECELWDELTDLRLLYCIEWDEWFEITVSLSDGTEVTKSISATHLPQAELSQIMLYDIEINTEDDIARDDYTKPTVIYDPQDPNSSLLNRILSDKAPHYTIVYVDASLINIQRTFTFDNISIHDAINEICEEINAVPIYGEYTNALMGKRLPRRTISLYDLSYICNTCGYRGDIFDVCPECGSTDITHGYGNDTTIFVAKDNLTNEVDYSINTDRVKNCFRLEAGDELMTATVANCNPNGTAYLWYISDDMKADMPTGLVNTLNSYNVLYNNYENTYEFNLTTSNINKYNNLIDKYYPVDAGVEHLSNPITGYKDLTKAFYDVIDFQIYLSDGMLPTYQRSDTTALEQAAQLTVANMSPIAVSNYQSISSSTVDNYVSEMAKIVVDSRYEAKINTSSFENYIWTGNFTVTNYSDETDTATSTVISIYITDAYDTYLEQKIEKVINKNETDDYSLSSILSKSVTKNQDGTFSGDLIDELEKYNLSSLEYILSACQSVIDLLIEEGVGDDIAWTTSEQNLYDQLYAPYFLKLQAIEYEISVRETDIELLNSVYQEINSYRSEVRNTLNMTNYLGEYWQLFCSYRREDTYDNSNFVSDGLTNKQLFDNAEEFMDSAKKEIVKSATAQHNISSTLKNLLTIKEFSKLVDYFDIWNWIRIEVDGQVYKLRLTGYTINFDDLDNIDVEFSDVIKNGSVVSDSKSIMDSMTSISSSYDTVSKQSETGLKAQLQIKEWKNDGFSTGVIPIINGDDNSITFDKHGILIRSYNEPENLYSTTQLKIINSTLAITTDGWQTTRAAIGLFRYIDPDTSVMKSAYGVNGEVVIGKLILGDALGIYNASASMKFNKNGLTITNGTNTVTINPNANSVFTISKGSSNIIYFDTSGNAYFNGNIYTSGGEIGGFEITSSSIHTKNVAIESNATNSVGLSSSTFTRTINGTSRSDLKFAIGSNFGVTKTGVLYAGSVDLSGKIVASDGTIGGWTITSNSIKGTYDGKTTGMQAPVAGATWAFAAGATTENNWSTAPFRVSHTGALTAENAAITGSITASSGNIGGWIIAETKISKAFTLGTATYTVILRTSGGSTSHGVADTVRAIEVYKTENSTTNSQFYVGSDGYLFAKNANITGTITSSDGTIGGWSIGSKTLSSTNTTTGRTSGLQTPDSYTIGLAIGATNPSNWSTAPFYVTHDGELHASNAIITGSISATSGTIGYGTNKFTIGTTDSTNSSIYYGMTSLSDTTHNGFYIGADGIALGKGAFKVTNSGSLYASNATITGSVTATTGGIGGWTIDNNSIYKTFTIGTATYTVILRTSGGANSHGVSGTIRPIEVFKTEDGSSATQFYVGSDGYMRANNAYIVGTISASDGDIGGFTIDSTSIRSGELTSVSNGAIGLSTANFTRSINGTSRSNLRFAIGQYFGVSNSGVLYAHGADISGTVSASSGDIGGWTITSSSIKGTYDGKTTGMQAPASGATWAFAAGATTENNWTTAPFRVSHAGKLYASNAEISGTIVSEDGTIGGWTIGGTQISRNVITGGYEYKAFLNAPSTISDPSNTSAYLIAIRTNDGNGNTGSWSYPFRVRYDGTLVTTKLNATGGDIGGFTIDSSSLRTAALTSTASGSIGLSSSDFTRTIGGESRSNLRFAIGGSFGISKTGILYVNGADINGKITADSGTIGGWTLSSHSLKGTGTYSSQSYTTGFQVPGNGTWALAIGSPLENDWSSAPFRIEHSGIAHIIRAEIDTAKILSPKILGDMTFIEMSGSTEVTKSVITHNGNYLVLNGLYVVDHYAPVGTGTVNVGTFKCTDAATFDSSITVGANVHINASSTANQLRFRMSNSLMAGAAQISASGAFGLYNITDSRWLIYDDGTGVKMPTASTVSAKMTFSTAPYLNNNIYLSTQKADGETNVPLIGWSSGNALWIGCYVSAYANRPSSLNLGADIDNVYVFNGSSTKVKLSTVVSDKRFKYDIEDLTNAKSFIMGLKAKSYRLNGNNSKRLRFGFIAQEVRPLMEETLGDSVMITYNPIGESDSYDPNNADTFSYSMDYTQFIAPHIAVTQEHDERIEKLEKEIKELKAMIKVLRRDDNG